MVNNSLHISSDGVFYSIQGEGISMGLPAVFLRLQLCNLRCVWCDTKFTWDQGNSQYQDTAHWTVAQTKKNIVRVWNCRNRMVQKRLVITGGEPLLQQNLLESLCKSLGDTWQIEIETNGTVMPTAYLLEHCQFNCSPKLNNSGNKTQIRINKPVLKTLNKANTLFKFVASCEADINELEQDFIKPCHLDLKKIIIMPQGITNEEIQHNSQAIIESVKDKGYRILGRLHISIWGPRKGV